MAKLIVISILLVTVVASTWLSSSRLARSGLRRTQWITVAFVFVWAYMCLSWYPQLVPVEAGYNREAPK